MKLHMLCSIAGAALLAGCAESHEHMGAANDGDHNVLTGGPTAGTTLQQLPEAVKQTLKQRLPHAEIADIDKKTQNGKVVYQISFKEAGKNPKLYITEDGRVVSYVDDSEMQSK